MALPDGWTEAWFVVHKGSPRSQHVLISKDPALVTNPSGKRAFLDQDILYKAKLTPQQFDLGLSRLIELYKQGRDFNNPNRENINA